MNDELLRNINGQLIGFDIYLVSVFVFVFFCYDAICLHGTIHTGNSRAISFIDLMHAFELAHRFSAACIKAHILCVDFFPVSLPLRLKFDAISRISFLFCKNMKCAWLFCNR